MNEQEFLNYSSCSVAAQLLSIPSQLPDPPKHSTPKKVGGGDNNVSRPLFDQSSIYPELERKSSTSSLIANMLNRAAIISDEKGQVSNFLENELLKRRTTTTTTTTTALLPIKEQQHQTLDMLNKRIARDEMSSCGRDTATTADLVAAYRKVPKFDVPPRISRPQSSASDTDITSASRSKLAFERGKDKLNFYCVPVDEALVLRMKFWNLDTMQMRLKCGITDENGAAEHPNFKALMRWVDPLWETLALLARDIAEIGGSTLLTSFVLGIVEVTAPIMEPGGLSEIVVQYKPTKVERNYAHLVLERTNCEYFKKTFPLIGEGGCADVGLSASNFEDGIAKKATSSQAIVLQPDDPNHFWLEFENRGQRPAYVKLVATNRFGKSIGGDQIGIKPNQFVLPAYNVDDLQSKKVSVRVCEAFDWCGEQSECPFRIEAYWGEEQQRQRLKCWFLKRKQPLPSVNGINFLSDFDGEPVTNFVQRQRDAATLTDAEATEFKNSLRQLTFNVINGLANAYFAPTQLDVCFSTNLQ